MILGKLPSKVHVSTHAPAWGATWYWVNFPVRCIFQLTPPRGGRRVRHSTRREVLVSRDAKIQKSAESPRSTSDASVISGSRSMSICSGAVSCGALSSYMAMSCKAAFWLALKPSASPTAAPKDIAFQKSIIPLLSHSVANKKRENKRLCSELPIPVVETRGYITKATREKLLCFPRATPMMLWQSHRGNMASMSATSRESSKSIRFTRFAQ